MWPQPWLRFLQSLGAICSHCCETIGAVACGKVPPRQFTRQGLNFSISTDCEQTSRAGNLRPIENATRGLRWRTCDSRGPFAPFPTNVLNLCPDLSNTSLRRCSTSRLLSSRWRISLSVARRGSYRGKLPQTTSDIRYDSTWSDSAHEQEGELLEVIAVGEESSR